MVRIKRLCFPYSQVYPVTPKVDNWPLNPVKQLPVKLSEGSGFVPRLTPAERIKAFLEGRPRPLPKRSPKPPRSGWIYALFGTWHDNEIVKVGRTGREHPGHRAVNVLFYEAWVARGERNILWASKSDDIVADELAVHRALDSYRYHEWERNTWTEGYTIGEHSSIVNRSRWRHVSGNEMYVYNSNIVLDAIAAVTQNTPQHFPDFLEDIELTTSSDVRRTIHYLLDRCQAILDGGLTSWLGYEFIYYEWHDFPHSPSMKGRHISPKTASDEVGLWLTIKSAANSRWFRRPSLRGPAVSEVLPPP